MLEGGDGTVGVGEGGLEMGEDCAAAGRRAGAVGNSGGGQRPSSAVRMRLWPRSKRFQMRCQVRSLRAVGGADGGGDACRRRRVGGTPQSVRVVRLSRRILSASQTLKVRPQPGRRWRLLQKIRRARTVFRWGLPSSKP